MIKKMKNKKVRIFFNLQRPVILWGKNTSSPAVSSLYVSFDITSWILGENGKNIALKMKGT